ncbi:MAG: signal peptide peptidase SppA [Planctomycetota bacterium]|jgi:protease-4
MRNGLVLLCLGACALLQGCIYAPFDLGLERIGQIYEATVEKGPSDQKILLLRIDGEISDHPGEGGLIGALPATTSQVRQELDLARLDEDICGVLVRINSPGGGVTASDVVYHELKRYREETGRPVVAYFMDTAASGGYYIAQAADVIVSSPTTITGSIGVIAQFPNVTELGEKIGVQMDTITSGPNKDLGNPFKKMDPEDRAIIQGVIDDMYGRFVEVVTTGRRGAGMSVSEVKAAADGRIYTAAQAKKRKLVDEVGYLDDAIALLRGRAGVTAARVITYERRALGGQRPTVYTHAQAPGGTLRVAGGEGAGALVEFAGRVLPRKRGPVLKYLWVP